ncbi:MAG: NifB/NifX family molybdenum-iron cluster-binding protein [Propionibacteriaceae bacterium]
MKFVIPVTQEGACGHAWGRAHYVALAHVDNGEITNWQVEEVRWDELHNAEGNHHARIVRYLRDNEVEAVVADHMGQGMALTLDKLGLPIFAMTSDDARECVIAAATGHAGPMTKAHCGC